ncbi:MAG: MaoC family dehydratase N-terminal domain-containing protein [Bryobacteraceae bacterium]
MATQQVYFEDVEIGQEIPQVQKGPMSVGHIMRWSAAMENWHRIHYDKAYATQHDKLPDIMVNGSWKQHVLMQLLKDWAGLRGWAWKVAFQYRDMDLPGDLLTAWGKVTKKYEQDGVAFVELEIGLKNSRGVESTKGSAVVALPKRTGQAVPYPFPVGLGAAPQATAR